MKKKFHPGKNKLRLLNENKNPYKENVYKLIQMDTDLLISVSTLFIRLIFIG